MLILFAANRPRDLQQAPIGEEKNTDSLRDETQLENKVKRKHRDKLHYGQQL